ncbi:TPA: hypothetical protein JG914_004333 [Enterobacter hormaechei subsp. steigerwaltii]|nr:hypothetical protein [Enterobacter hormaechei subsp. steigerwaltii]
MGPAGPASLRRAEVAMYEHAVMGITRVTNPHDRQLNNSLHVNGKRRLTTGACTPLQNCTPHDPMHYLKACFVSRMGRTGSVLLFRR